MWAPPLPTGLKPEGLFKKTPINAYNELEKIQLYGWAQTVGYLQGYSGFALMKCPPNTLLHTRIHSSKQTVAIVLQENFVAFHKA